MKDEILFKESQPFWRNWLATIVTVFVSLLFIWEFIQQVFFGILCGNNPMSDLGLGIFSGFMLLLIALLFFQQRTFITKEGIYVRYFPLDFKTRFFDWNEIRDAHIRKYSPLTEYGGWGIRHQFSAKKSVAYNVSGNVGLQLILKNGEKILIGTKKQAELEEVLTKLNDNFFQNNY